MAASDQIASFSTWFCLFEREKIFVCLLCFKGSYCDCCLNLNLWGEWSVLTAMFLIQRSRIIGFYRKEFITIISYQKDQISFLFKAQNVTAYLNARYCRYHFRSYNNLFLISNSVGYNRWLNRIRKTLCKTCKTFCFNGIDYINWL